MKTIFHILSIIVICTVCSGCTDKHEEYLHRRTSKTTSLFVATDRHEIGTGNNLTALLQSLTSNLRNTPPELILLGGDYVGEGPDKGETGQPAFHVSDVTNDITKALGCNVGYDVLLTYGSHDRGAIEGYSPFFSGPRICNGYYVYGISFAQMKYPTDSTTLAVDTTLVITTDSISGLTDTTVLINTYSGLDLADKFGISAQSAVPHFTTWVKSLSDHAPIIIMSHVPMHANRNDNLGAHTWFRAIYEAAKSHDILVLFGHNHTLEERGNPADGYCYLLTPGDGIIIQGIDAVHSERLNFSYANAGYIKLGSSSLITFTDTDNDNQFDIMTMRRYSLNGENNIYFGLTGNKNPYNILLTKSH